MKMLYVILRNDLKSLSQGKALAMSGHAASLFAYHNFTKPEYKEWAGLYGFGYQINLVGSKEQLDAIISNRPPGFPIQVGKIYDPTYSYSVEPEIFKLIDEEYHTETPIYCEVRQVWKCYRNEFVGIYLFGEGDDIKPLVGSLQMAG